MKWKKFMIETTVEAEDILISTLYDIGLEGAQIEDKVPLTEQEKIQAEILLPEAVESPVRAGEAAGRLLFYLDGAVIGETALVYAASVADDRAPQGFWARLFAGLAGESPA